MIASMIRSQSLSASTEVVPDRLASVAVARVRGHLAPGDAVLEELLDAAEALVEKRLIDLAHDRLVARRRAHLRDAGAHQPAPQHADRLDSHCLLGQA